MVRVISASICGTDLRIFRGLHQQYPPGTVRIPGHEVVGRLEQLSGRVEGLEVGQVVFVAPNMGCGHCRQCLRGSPNLCPNFSAIGVTIDGGFADFLLVPAPAVVQGNLIPLDDNADLSMAALIEPLACVLRGQEAADVHAGDVVLVLGAGPIGMLHVMLAKYRGAKRVIVSEIVAERLDHVEKLGADRVVNPHLERLETVVRDETEGEGADVVIVAASVGELQAAALEVSATGGRIVLFGGLPSNQAAVSLNTNRVHYKELKVTGSTGCSTLDCRHAAELAVAGAIDLSRIVGGRYTLSNIGPAFEAAQERKALKVFIEPGS